MMPALVLALSGSLLKTYPILGNGSSQSGMTAFQDYNERFRPFIEEVQAEVIDFGLDVLIPRTDEAIQKRYKDGLGF